MDADLFSATSRSARRHDLADRVGSWSLALVPMEVSALVLGVVLGLKVDWDLDVVSPLIVGAEWMTIASFALAILALTLGTRHVLRALGSIGVASLLALFVSAAFATPY